MAKKKTVAGTKEREWLFIFTIENSEFYGELAYYRFKDQALKTLQKRAQRFSSIEAGDVDLSEMCYFTDWPRLYDRLETSDVNVSDGVVYEVRLARPEALAQIEAAHNEHGRDIAYAEFVVGQHGFVWWRFGLANCDLVVETVTMPFEAVFGEALRHVKRKGKQ